MYLHLLELQSLADKIGTATLQPIRLPACPSFRTLTLQTKILRL
jgi:hypothetical protein